LSPAAANGDTLEKLMGPPLLRASVIKQLLDAVDRLPPADAQRIRSLAPADTIARIEAATRVEWMPYELHVRLDEAVFEVLGRERFIAFRRYHNSRLTESPALRSVLAGTLSLFGVSPRRIYHMVPRVYDNMCRDAGRVDIVDTDPTSLRIVYHDVPSHLVANPVWRLGLIGSFQLILEITKSKGTVEVTEYDADRKHVLVTATWEK